MNEKIDKAKKGAPEKDLKFHLFCYTLGKEEIFHSLARNFETQIMMLKDRITKLAAIGLGSTKFITRDEWHKQGKQGKCFIAVKTMRDLPRK